MTDLAALLADLAAESDDADRLVAELTADGWATPTPAPGWTVAHQIAHLTWTDDQARRAATDPDGFTADLARALADTGPADYAGHAADALAALEPAVLLGRWRTGRATLTAALAGLPPGSRLPWFGPPMAPASMATARIMETWAHTQDIADALGRPHPPTGRLRHIAHLGVRARDYAYRAHGLDAPGREFRVELTPPGGGEPWTWGPPGAAERVTGPAHDFCLLVTQRRHRADLLLRAEGAEADRWLDVAQAFAGPPGEGRQPGQFA